MSADTPQRLHPTDATNCDDALPQLLNDPFDYVPYPLCRKAADEVFAYLEQHPEWSAELDNGKMFGVSIVRDRQGTVSFLAAFSGNLDGKNDHPYFVPPIFDMLQPDGFFRREESEISEINRRILALETSQPYRDAVAAFLSAETSAREEVRRFRTAMEQRKRLRDEVRSRTDDTEVLGRLDNESRRDKSELRRLKEECRRRTDAARKAVNESQAEIDALKAERRLRSENLQKRLFASFEIVNAEGCRRNLLDIFAESEQTLPPAGAGECAAPKLLQYAFLNGLTTLSIAEFWYGRSPKGEVRRHGSSYPACRGKCKPILDFMLSGVQLDRRPKAEFRAEPSVVFEDEHIIVIEKPAGMLSVEGKIDCPSVEKWVRERPAGTGEPKIVHRLDMDVSGLLLIAKELDSYRRLQEQFLHRTVKKRYIALLQGEIAADEGRIELPMRPDPADRPRQVVDALHGKAALTLYRVTERREGFTRVELEPVTGRTHQLRVHAAAAEGLNAPIVGDTLYGAEPAARLCLHNEFIGFDHPVTGERMEFHSVLPPEEAF